MRGCSIATAHRSPRRRAGRARRCAAPASAKIVEVGGDAGRRAGLPGDARASRVSRTTGYQIKVGDERSSFIVPEDGKIVAWTIALGKPTRRADRVLRQEPRRPASARLTVLRPGKTLYSRVIGQSPVQQLAAVLRPDGAVPARRALNVKKGYVIALTVPTWAPALTPLLTDLARGARPAPKGKCDDTGTQTAQTPLNSVTQYRCLYKARLTYWATLVTRPVPNPPRPAAPGRRLARRRRGELDARGAVGHLRRVVAEQVEQRVDDVRVELACRRRRAARRPPRAGAARRGRARRWSSRRRRGRRG